MGKLKKIFYRHIYTVLRIFMKVIKNPQHCVNMIKKSFFNFAKNSIQTIHWLPISLHYLQESKVFEVCKQFWVWKTFHQCQNIWSWLHVNSFLNSFPNFWREIQNRSKNVSTGVYQKRSWVMSTLIFPSKIFVSIKMYKFLNPHLILSITI